MGFGQRAALLLDSDQGTNGVASGDAINANNAKSPPSGAIQGDAINEINAKRVRRVGYWREEARGRFFDTLDADSVRDEFRRLWHTMEGQSVAALDAVMDEFGAALRRFQ